MTSRPNPSPGVRPNVLTGQTVPNTLGGFVPANAGVPLRGRAVGLGRPGARFVTAVVVLLLVVAFLITRS